MRGERREVFWFPEKVRRAQAGICAAFGVTEQVSRRSRRFALSWIVANPNPNEGQQHRATKVTTCNTLPGISGISAGRHPGRLLGASHIYGPFASEMACAAEENGMHVRRHRQSCCWRRWMAQVSMRRP